MGANIIRSGSPGGARTKLKDAVPLSTPYVVQIFPIYLCNFRCNYCHFSSPPYKRDFVTDKTEMDFNLFKKILDEMKLFPDKIKTLRFVGIGEPLLHKRVTDMIAYAKQLNVANTVEILTNASLLTKEKSDSLIASGLDRLVVSLQGVSSHKYKEISKYNIDFNKLVEDLRYFYKNKTHTHVYIKVVDLALDSDEDKKIFYEIFGDICDSIGIEHAVPIFEGAEANDILSQDTVIKTQFGLSVPHVEICPQPFYTMQINPDGKVVGCHSVPYPSILGNCNNDTVYDIWSCLAYNEFRLKMLNGRSDVCVRCRECNIMNYRFSQEDDISGEAERLKEYYGK